MAGGFSTNIDCGSKPNPSSSSYNTFDQAGWERASAAHEAAMVVYNDAVTAWENSDAYAEIQRIRGDADTVGSIAHAEAELVRNQTELSELEEEHMVDGEWSMQARIDLLTEGIELLRDAVSEIQLSAPDTLEGDAQGSSLTFTAGSTFELASQTMSNILYTRDKIFANGVSATYNLMRDSVMAAETAEMQRSAAIAYSDLAEEMDYKDNMMLAFQMGGFALGAIGGMFAGGVGAAAGASLGMGAGSLLGNAFGRI